MLKRTHSGELSISKFPTLKRKKAAKSKNPSSKWPGGHKSNAESKHVSCSFISIYYQLNPPRETDAKPKLACNQA